MRACDPVSTSVVASSLRSHVYHLPSEAMVSIRRQKSVNQCSVFGRRQHSLRLLTSRTGCRTARLNSSVEWQPRASRSMKRKTATAAERPLTRERRLEAGCGRSADAQRAAASDPQGDGGCPQASMSATRDRRYPGHARDDLRSAWSRPRLASRSSIAVVVGGGHMLSSRTRQHGCH